MKKVAIALLLLGLLLILPATFAQDQQNIPPAQQAIIDEMKKICADYRVLEKQMLELKDQYRIMYGDNSDFVLRIEMAYKHSQEKMIAAQLDTSVVDLSGDMLFSALKNAKSAQEDLQLVVNILLKKGAGTIEVNTKIQKELQSLIVTAKKNIEQLKDGAEKDGKINPDETIKQALKDNKEIIDDIPNLTNKGDQQTTENLQREIDRQNQVISDLQKLIDKQEDAGKRAQAANDANIAKMAENDLKTLRQMKNRLSEMEKKQGHIIDDLNKIGENFFKAPELAALEQLTQLREKVKAMRKTQEGLRKQAEEAKASDRPVGSFEMERLKDGLGKALEGIALLKERQEEALGATRSAAETKADPAAAIAAKTEKAKLDDLLEKLLKLRDRQLENSNELESAAGKGALLKPFADKQNALNAEVAKVLDALSEMKSAGEAVASAKKAAESMTQAALRIGENKDQEAVAKQSDAVEQLDSATQKMSQLSDKLERAANPGALDIAADRQRAANKLADHAEQMLQQIPAGSVPKDVDLAGAAKKLQEARDNMNKSLAALDTPEPEVDVTNPQTFKDLQAARNANAANSTGAQQKALEQIAAAAQALDGVMDQVSQHLMSPEEQAAAKAQQAAAAQASKLADELAAFAKNNPAAAADLEQMNQAVEGLKQAAADMAAAGENLSKGQAGNGADKQGNAAKGLAGAQSALAKAQMAVTAKSQQGNAIAPVAAAQEQLAAQAKAAAEDLHALAQKSGQSGKEDESKAMGAASGSAAKAVAHMDNSLFQSQTGQLPKAQEQGAEAKRLLAEARLALEKQEKELSKIAENNTPKARQDEQNQIRKDTQNTAKQMTGAENKSGQQSGNQGKPENNQGQQANNPGQQGQGGNQQAKSGGQPSKSGNQQSQGGGQMAQAGQKAQSAAQDMQKAEEAIPRDTKEAMRSQAEALKKLRDARDEVMALRQKAQDQLGKTASAQVQTKQKKLREMTAKLAKELSKQENGKSGEGQGQAGAAGQDAGKAADKLKKASDILRAAEEATKRNQPDEAAKKHKEVEKELLAARDELTRLAKAQKAANENQSKNYGDVAKSNDNMTQQLKRITNELRQNGASQASQSASAAGKSSSQAAEDIRNKQMRDALEQEKRLLDELRKAEKEVRERILRQLAEKDQEKLETMIAVITRMLEGEININATTQKIDTERTAKKSPELDRGLDTSISKIADAQKDLHLIAKELHQQLAVENAVVFTSEMDIIQNNMEDVWNSLNKDRDTGALVQDIEQDIINNLTLLKSCLERSLRRHQERVKNESKPPKDGPPQPSKPQKPDLVAPLAELILIQSKQAGVNRKTVTFHRQRVADFTAKNPNQTPPDNSELTRALKQSLRRIGKEQFSLAQYTEALNGQIKAIIIREGYAGKPEKLPLGIVANEMMGVKKRLDQELTNSITKKKQTYIVKMLNDMIEKAQLQVVPKEPKKKPKKSPTGKSPRGPEKDKLEPDRTKFIGDPQPGQVKSQQKKPGQKKPGPGNKPGSKGGNNPPQNPTGSDPKSGGSPLNPDRSALNYSINVPDWMRQDEAEFTPDGIVEYENEFPAEYQEEIRAYFNFLQEHRQQELEKKRLVPLSER